MGDSLRCRSLQYRGRIIIGALSPFLSEEKSVLDIGCGNGVVSSQIAERFGCRLVGTDILYYTTKDLPFLRMQEDYTLPFKDNEFDIGLFNDVLHHMPFEKQILLVTEALRVCSEVLIFEAKPTLAAKFLDRVANHIHYPEIPITLTHRTKKDWLELLSSGVITAEAHDVKKPFPLYPFTNFLLRLSAPRR